MTADERYAQRFARKLAAQRRLSELHRAVECSIQLERAGRYLEAEEAVAAFGRSDLVEEARLYNLRHRLRAAS